MDDFLQRGLSNFVAASELPMQGLQDLMERIPNGDMGAASGHHGYDHDHGHSHGHSHSCGHGHSHGSGDDMARRMQNIKVDDRDGSDDDDDEGDDGTDGNVIALPDGSRVRLGEGWDAEMAASLRAAMRDEAHENERRLLGAPAGGRGEAAYTVATISIEELQQRTRALGAPVNILMMFDLMISNRIHYKDVKIGTNVLDIMVERVSAHPS